MHTWKLILPAGIVMAGFLFCTTATFGTPTYMKNANVKNCTVCHVKTAAPDVMKKDPNLTAIGQCFQKNNHTIDKCNVPPDDFKK